VSPAGLFFGLAFLLGLAAGRELLVARATRRAVRNSRDASPGNSAGGGLGTERPAAAGVSPAAQRLARPWARVALWFDLPERVRRSGLEARLPLPAVLLGKFAGACLGAILALGAAPAAPGRIGILVALGLPAAGFFVPDALLEREARRRRRRLVAALPDALDLLAVSVASGRGPADGLA
jgi:pilus assembly protein TadC